MKIWISPEVQKEGFKVDYFMANELKNINARDITQSQIFSILLTPDNVMKLYDGLPTDFEQKACLYRPLLYSSKVVTSNIKREIKITFQLGYGKVDNINTSLTSALEKTLCEITITGFKEVKESQFDPVSERRMDQH